MEIIPPPTVTEELVGTWIAPGGPLPGLKQSGTVSPRACPQCDSRAQKMVHKIGRRLELECPVCGARWGLR